jgi:nucleoside-diphosphate-sugar epimerase
MMDVALVGARGYVGRGLRRALEAREGIRLRAVAREDHSAAQSAGRYDVVINASMPSARYRAGLDPGWDFDRSVAATARLLYEWDADKFIQISSISARSQRDTVYGRHKAAAELLLRMDRDLVVRLGPMYSDDLDKGVLIDMLEGRKVWVDATSRYCFAPRDWAAGWIADNLGLVGVVEVGARDALAVGDVAAHLDAPVEFAGVVDHQEVLRPGAGFPSAGDVLRWLDGRVGAGAPS